MGPGLEERQILELGTPVPDPAEPAFLAMPVRVASYEKGSDAGKTARAAWRCDDDPVAMHMTAAIHSGPPRNLDISLDAVGSPILYPTSVAGRLALDDVAVTVKIVSGVLRLFGTRTKLSFTDRVAEPLGTAQAPPGVRGAYRITSKARARTFVLGIPVRRLRLSAEKSVDPDTGLLRHELRFDDGRLSVTERLGASASGSHETRGARGHEEDVATPSNVAAE